MACLLATFILILKLTGCEEAAPDAFISLSAVAGETANLPCDTISPIDEDEIYLVLWYKDESTTPIYSLDSRKGRLPQARHSTSEILAQRIYFSIVNKPSVLEIVNLLASDEGEYRCRVDFRKARTRHSTVYLQIIVPPGIPVIKGRNGEILQGVVGPYNEGERLLVICECEGGKPSPSLTWWRNGTIFDNSFKSTFHNRVRNELEIAVLKRTDLMAVYTCKASNNNVSIPTFSSITLEMNFRPLEVNIEGEKRPFSGNKTVELTCTTRGSRPPAAISWWNGNRKLKELSQQAIGSETISTVKFIPTSGDHGKLLRCQADNLVIPGSVIQDYWKLDIHFSPQLVLRLGSKLRHSNIQEGKDVYFECSINANPWVTEINWLFENEEIHTNVTSGIIVSNQTLVLQRVRRTSRGEYSCMAKNSEGVGGSNQVHLRVQFSPVCKKGQKLAYGAMLHSAIRITCDVEADPSDVTFRWEFNNTSSSMLVAPYHNSNTRSIVNHIPRTYHDFGTLYCWGKNSVGMQRKPCMYSILPANVPEDVRNCSISSETERSFLLHCLEGSDGGLKQSFYMEVRNALTNKLRINISSDSPNFVARGLTASTDYVVKVCARNAKGNSSGVLLKITTLAAPESHMRKDGDWHLSVSPVLLVLITVMGGLVSVALSIVIYVKTKAVRQERKGNSVAMDSLKAQKSSNVFRDDGFTGEEKKNYPDLLTANGVVSNIENREAKDDMIIVSDDGIGWKKLPRSKSSEYDFSNKIIENTLKDHKDIHCVSQAPNVVAIPANAKVSSGNAKSETPKCVHSLKICPAVSSSSVMTLESNKQTEV